MGPDDHSHGVTVGFRDHSGLHQLRADRCVCALPFAPLHQVRLDAGFSHDKLAWQEDPWAVDGWGSPQPGDLHWIRPAMRRPERRVHFAGEHTATLWPAWMNGALGLAVSRILSHHDAE
jgi:monoamine oxidase